MYYKKSVKIKRFIDTTGKDEVRNYYLEILQRLNNDLATFQNRYNRNCDYLGKELDDNLSNLFDCFLGLSVSIGVSMNNLRIKTQQ